MCMPTKLILNYIMIIPNRPRANHISNTSVQLVRLFCGLSKSVVRIILINCQDLSEAVANKQIDNNNYYEIIIE